MIRIILHFEFALFYFYTAGEKKITELRLEYTSDFS